jgi:hypothetical protein
VYARNLYALTHVTEYFPSVYLYLLESPPLEGARFWKLYKYNPLISSALFRITV